jgi:octaheme c-type cytochrome (tetrathionate reductase family)
MKVLFLLPLLLIAVSPSFAQDHKENVTGPFETPQQVTEECLMCHEEVANEIFHSNHWNWLTSNIAAFVQQGKITGKRIPINNFCIAVKGDSPQCTTCHLTESQKDSSFNFKVAENIDCLVCHEQTGTYMKAPFHPGMAESENDLLTIAQSVAKPTSKNCGTCHFSKSGGVLVKHGGMDESLYNPTEEVDYHLGGLGFGCSDCHETKNHQIAGGINSEGNAVSCENCHEANPHKKELLNNHCAAVACETCHIPSYAREEATVISWDWSKAGEDRDSTAYNVGDKFYDKRRGELVLSKNVKPEYYWANGIFKYYKLGEKIETNNLLELNKPGGKISDANSKISPFKVIRAKQPYDLMNKYLIIPKIYGEDGYWKTFNWASASEAGMKEVNLEFSGSVDFIQTKMYWPINHLVMSADNALKCTSCHGKGGEKLLNWKDLGYPDDPIKKGGRVKNKLIKE